LKCKAGVYHRFVRTLPLPLIVSILGVGCAGEPARIPTALAPGPAVERWPTAEEAAGWTISRDEALRIARASLEDQDRRHMIYHSDPVVCAGESFWRVTGASVIAGGWEAEIDARTGAILRMRHLPGR